MEKLFSALAHADRLWVVIYLAAEGPKRQKALIAALHDTDPTRRPIGSGAMSNLVHPLVEAGLLQRDGRNGELRLANPEQVGRLLTLASSLSVARTGESSRKADELHARLMRAITQSRAETTKSTSD